MWLQAGDRFDRYGGVFGKFVAPIGTAEAMRALPPGSTDRPYHVYEVVKPFEVQSGRIAPAFDQIGGGIQFLLPLRIGTLLNSGIIREVEP
ncbi:MAG TPA: TNT domain-containing protein [Pseudonocardiaceae bacterium]